MLKSFLYSFILFLLPLSAYPFEGGISANQGWNDSAGFPTTYERLAKTTIAESIEKKRSGYYEGWDQTNYTINNTAIGAQTVFSESNLENVQVSNASCGNSSATTSLETTGTTENHNDSAPCKIENRNENTP